MDSTFKCMFSLSERSIMCDPPVFKRNNEQRIASVCTAAHSCSTRRINNHHCWMWWHDWRIIISKSVNTAERQVGPRRLFKESESHKAGFNTTNISHRRDRMKLNDRTSHEICVDGLQGCCSDAHTLVKINSEYFLSPSSCPPKLGRCTHTPNLKTHSSVSAQCVSSSISLRLPAPIWKRPASRAGRRGFKYPPQQFSLVVYLLWIPLSM